MNRSICLLVSAPTDSSPCTVHCCWRSTKKHCLPEKIIKCLAKQQSKACLTYGSTIYCDTSNNSYNIKITKILTILINRSKHYDSEMYDILGSKVKFQFFYGMYELLDATFIRVNLSDDEYLKWNLVSLVSFIFYLLVGPWQMVLPYRRPPLMPSHSLYTHPGIKPAHNGNLSS